MLLVLGLLLLQARLLLPCMLLRTKDSFTADLKYTITAYKSFDECAQACYNDIDCVYVAYGNGSQSPTDTTCKIYKRGLTIVSAHPKVYEMNRTEEDTSKAMCSDVVPCLAAQKYTVVNATVNVTIEEEQCPSNASIVTVNVYQHPTQKFHLYAMNGTDPPLDYQKMCSMQFLGTELPECNSVPVYTRGSGDYLRFFFGDAYQKFGYFGTSMSVLPQPCIYNGTQQCYSFVKIQEYKRGGAEDFVYSSDIPTTPLFYDSYMATEVNQAFWIVGSDCKF